MFWEVALSKEHTDSQCMCCSEKAKCCYEFTAHFWKVFKLLYSSVLATCSSFLNNSSAKFKLASLARKLPGVCFFFYTYPPIWFFPLFSFVFNKWWSPHVFSCPPQTLLLFQLCYLIHILLSTLTLHFKTWIRLMIEFSQIKKMSLWKENKTLGINKQNGFHKSWDDWSKWGRRGNRVLVNCRPWAFSMKS